MLRTLLALPLWLTRRLVNLTVILLALYGGYQADRQAGYPVSRYVLGTVYRVYEQWTRPASADYSPLALEILRQLDSADGWASDDDTDERLTVLTRGKLRVSHVTGIQFDRNDLAGVLSEKEKLAIIARGQDISRAIWNAKKGTLALEVAAGGEAGPSDVKVRITYRKPAEPQMAIPTYLAVPTGVPYIPLTDRHP